MQLRTYKFKQSSSFRMGNLTCCIMKDILTAELLKIIEFVDCACEKIQRLYQG